LERFFRNSGDTKASLPSVVITVSLLCFGFSPAAKALLPAPSPDGSYPGANTAEGINALHDVNTAVGINNTAVGANALASDTTGYSNVAIGEAALANNTTGNFNMAIGTEALTNSTANYNVAIGFRVGFMNTTGMRLTGIGAGALRNNTGGDDNTAVGADALRENTTGAHNTAIGIDALTHNSNSLNTATGDSALFSNTVGANNTANGVDALYSNTRGHYNTAVGVSALYGNTGEYSDYNTATGAYALANTQTGSFTQNNTATGAYALSGNTTGSGNTANGVGALSGNATGYYNTGIGFGAMQNASGNFNTALGFQAGVNQTIGSDNVYIGTGAVGAAGESNACYIASIFGQTSAAGVPVVINSNNKLGTATSSRRFKEEIQPMDKTSAVLLALKPVTFRYKREIDPARTSQFGLVAEEVEKVNPNLVVRDKEGKPYTVRYDAVNAMLLNEFLKTHRKVEEQNGKIQQQEATIT
jgi:hypothetical protein